MSTKASRSRDTTNLLDPFRYLYKTSHVEQSNSTDSARGRHCFSSPLRIQSEKNVDHGHAPFISRPIFAKLHKSKGIDQSGVIFEKVHH
jgi:hypothetical protein